MSQLDDEDERKSAEATKVWHCYHVVLYLPRSRDAAAENQWLESWVRGGTLVVGTNHWPWTGTTGNMTAAQRPARERSAINGRIADRAGLTMVTVMVMVIAVV
jgi:hypothetical protein